MTQNYQNIFKAQITMQNVILLSDDDDDDDDDDDGEDDVFVFCRWRWFVLVVSFMTLPPHMPA